MKKKLLRQHMHFDFIISMLCVCYTLTADSTLSPSFLPDILSIPITFKTAINNFVGGGCFFLLIGLLLHSQQNGRPNSTAHLCKS